MLDIQKQRVYLRSSKFYTCNCFWELLDILRSRPNLFSVQYDIANLICQEKQYSVFFRKRLSFQKKILCFNARQRFLFVFVVNLYGKISCTSNLVFWGFAIDSSNFLIWKKVTVFSVLTFKETSFLIEWVISEKTMCSLRKLNTLQNVIPSSELKKYSGKKSYAY